MRRFILFCSVESWCCYSLYSYDVGEAFWIYEAPPRHASKFDVLCDSQPIMSQWSCKIQVCAQATTGGIRWDRIFHMKKNLLGALHVTLAATIFRSWWKLQPKLCTMIRSIIFAWCLLRLFVHATIAGLAMPKSKCSYVSNLLHTLSLPVVYCTRIVCQCARPSSYTR
jgi:hypothetical protein